MAQSAPLPFGPGAPTIAAGGFAELDAALAAPERPLLVQATARSHGPLVRHAARRLRAAGLRPVLAAVGDGTSLFREVATALGLGRLPASPEEAADVIAARARAERAAIVVAPPSAGWDAAVASALAEAKSCVLVSFATELPGAGYEIDADLAEPDLRRWLGAAADDAISALAGSDLAALEAWWSGGGAAAPARQRHLEDAAPLALAVAGRTLPGGPALCDLDEAERRELRARANAEQKLDVAGRLSDIGDPWSLARAAELWLELGAPDRADEAIGRGLREALGSVALSAELDARWFERIRTVDGADALALRKKAAARALELGEAAAARRWCEAAAALAPEDPEVHRLLGRAFVQTGDLVAARVCFAKAERGCEDAELGAQILVDRAELAYVAGDLDGASDLARSGEARAASAAVRLAARSTLGKVLLARAEWDAADAHFAEDALTAAIASETTAELRARLNRAIARLSKGQLAEARALLELVLADATRLREERARAFASSNLGLVAYRQHDYGAALRWWEDTIRFPQALRGRLATALTIGNLADLRLRLGLVDHAEHAVAFGRRLFAEATPPPRCAALFHWVAAQIALARRDTALARSEVASALSQADASGDHVYVESAHIVAVKVALEDGDLARAAEALARAEAVAASPRGRAEVALVGAAYRRAAGLPALGAAEEALARVVSAGELDLLFEAHHLLAVLHHHAGALGEADAQAARALAVRDRIAAGLPADLRAAFLAKPDVAAAARLQASSRGADSPAPSMRPRREGPERVIVGDDPQIRSLALAIKKVARSNGTVLVRGESGTGKELVAEALHRASDRAAGPLVSVSCAALVETLLLSELFGHEKGAFTGATTRRRGRFEMAEGGTLFLDEIGDISARTQVALLRVLQEKTFERVGGTAPIRADVRVLCATHRDLRAMVERGEFREDLYYRLRGITLEVPPLRARLGDLPRIAEHLLERLSAERGEPVKRLSPGALELLGRHRWPGNVRELENVLRAAVVFSDADVLTTTDLTDNVDELRAVALAAPLSQRPDRGGRGAPESFLLRAASSSEEPPPSGPGMEEDAFGALPDDEANATAVAYAQVRQGAISLSSIKRQIERDCIARALVETRGNITRAAALLGMKRPRLSQLVKQYGLSSCSTSGSSEGSS